MPGGACRKETHLPAGQLKHVETAGETACLGDCHYVSFTGFCWSIVIPKWITLEFMRKLRVSYFGWWQAQFDQDDAASNVATISRKVRSWPWLKYLRWVGTSAQLLPFPSILFPKKKPESWRAAIVLSVVLTSRNKIQKFTHRPRLGWTCDALALFTKHSLVLGQFLNKLQIYGFWMLVGPGFACCIFSHEGGDAV